MRKLHWLPTAAVSLGLLTPTILLAQAVPDVDRSALEERKRLDAERERLKREATVEETSEQREARERQEKREKNVKEAKRRAEAAADAARRRQNTKALELMHAAWKIDPTVFDYPFFTGALAEALNDFDMEWRAMAAAQVLGKLELERAPADSPRHADISARMAKVAERLDFLRTKLSVGVIRLSSEPASCEIFLEGAFVGKGSGEIETPTGQRKVETQCPGFYDHELFVNVREGDPVSAVIKPKAVPYFGRLVVLVEPADGVTVFLDDQPVASRIADKPTKDGKIAGDGTRQAPFELSARKWIVRFQKDGYDRWHRRVEIRRDETVLVNARLEPLNESAE